MAITILRSVQMKAIPPPLSDHAKAIIKLLEGYLKRAKAGDVHGICITVAIPGGQYDFECAGCYEKYPSDAIGPLEVLKLKLTRQALDESD